MKRIVLSLPFAEENLLKIRQACQGAELTEISAGSLCPEDVRTADALLAYPSIDILKAAKQLTWLQLPTAGVESFIGNPAVPRQLTMTNSSGAFGDAIAEYILGEILAVNRNLYVYHENQREHRWQSAGRERSLYGSTVVILGVGDIGSSVARLLTPFNCHVIGIRRASGPIPEGFQEVYITEQLSNVLPEADFVICALPHTKDTANLLNRKMLTSVKSTALIVNVGRGSLIDMEALCEFLQDRKIRAAILDVLPEEPLEESAVLWNIPNLFLTPHISGRSFAQNAYTEARITAIFTENIRRFMLGEPLLNRVNCEIGYADRQHRFC